MKIYISFSSDKKSVDIYHSLKRELLHSGYKKSVDIYHSLKRELLHSGYKATSSIDIFVEPVEFIVDVIKREILESDIMIALINENYLESAICRTELSIASQNNIMLVPVVIGDDVSIPFSVHDVQYIHVKDEKHVTDEVMKFLSKLSKSDDKKQVIEENTTKRTEEGNREDQIKILKNALSNNQLTLVCGAGISIAPGIPTWKGKYLRLTLGKDFERKVKNQLYSNLKKDALSTPMLNAISGLARPKRSGVRLESVITFNFDDLIESKLSRDNINHCSIWKEGQSHDTNELPIYHVHGFLPNKDEIDSPNLVFSEESYHSQFIDPYSWSNLTQLNAFSSNICLFVGLSLSDPNLRRLLDISHRRNNKTKHFILRSKLPDSVDSEEIPEPDKSTYEIVNMLFEQDANSLGLNVLWYNKHSEIPDIIKSISK